MKTEFEMVWWGSLHSSWVFKSNKERKTYSFHKKKYARNIVKKFGLDSKKHASTPMSSSTKLNVDSFGVEVSPTLYRSIIGSLLYLTVSRPDIAFTVGVYARYQAASKESHLTVVKRIIRYVNGTPDYGLWYSKDSNACLVI